MIQQLLAISGGYQPRRHLDWTTFWLIMGAFLICAGIKSLWKKWKRRK
jgi:hypothetical protein